MIAITKYQLLQYMSDVMVSSAAVNKVNSTPEIPKHVVYEINIEKGAIGAKYQKNMTKLKQSKVCKEFLR